jgi:hypothetical protein
MRPRAVPAVALPAPGAFERLRGLPDKRVVDRLLRGRLCIWVIGVMLGGIVAMQVSLLRMNAGISRAVSTASVLEQQNADLEAENSRLTTGDKVRTFALDNGMIDPDAGNATFLTARPGTDAALAVIGLTVVAVTVVGNLFEIGENNRFRFMVEPITFVAFTWFVARLWVRARRWWTSRDGGRSAGPTELDATTDVGTGPSTDVAGVRG